MNIFKALDSNLSHTEKIKSAIAEKGFDANAVDEQGNPPLIYAAHKSDTEAVRLLLESGADANALGYDPVLLHHGYTPLLLATNGETGPNIELYKLLIDAGADVNAKAGNEKNGETPLHNATTNNESTLITPIFSIFHNLSGVVFFNFPFFEKFLFGLH